MANPSWRSGLGLSSTLNRDPVPGIGPSWLDNSLGRDSPSSRLNLGPRPGASPSSHWQPLAGTTSGTRPYQGGAAAPAGRPDPYAYSPRAYPPPPVNPGIPSPRQWPDSGASRPPNELQRLRDAVAAAEARVSKFERLTPQAGAPGGGVPAGAPPPPSSAAAYQPAASHQHPPPPAHGYQSSAVKVSAKDISSLSKPPPPPPAADAQPQPHAHNHGAAAPQPSNAEILRELRALTQRLSNPHDPADASTQKLFVAVKAQTALLEGIKAGDASSGRSAPPGALAEHVHGVQTDVQKLGIALEKLVGEVAALREDAVLQKLAADASPAAASDAVLAALADQKTALDAANARILQAVENQRSNPGGEPAAASDLEARLDTHQQLLEGILARLNAPAREAAAAGDPEIRAISARLDGQQQLLEGILARLETGAGAPAREAAAAGGGGGASDSEIRTISARLERQQQLLEGVLARFDAGEAAAAAGGGGGGRGDSELRAILARLDRQELLLQTLAAGGGGGGGGGLSPGTDMAHAALMGHVAESIEVLSNKVDALQQASAQPSGAPDAAALRKQADELKEREAELREAESRIRERDAILLERERRLLEEQAGGARRGGSPPETPPPPPIGKYDEGVIPPAAARGLRSGVEELSDSGGEEEEARPPRGRVLADFTPKRAPVLEGQPESEPEDDEEEVAAHGESMASLDDSDEAHRMFEELVAQGMPPQLAMEMINNGAMFGQDYA